MFWQEIIYFSPTARRSDELPRMCRCGRIDLLQVHRSDARDFLQPVPHQQRGDPRRTEQHPHVRRNGGDLRPRLGRIPGRFLLDGHRFDVVGKWPGRRGQAPILQHASGDRPVLFRGRVGTFPVHADRTGGVVGLGGETRRQDDSSRQDTSDRGPTNCREDRHEQNGLVTTQLPVAQRGGRLRGSREHGGDSGEPGTAPAGRRQAAGSRRRHPRGNALEAAGHPHNRKGSNPAEGRPVPSRQ